MTNTLKNKYAVICGSSQGIGFATAKALAAAGATCILIARNENSLKEAVAALPVPLQQQHGFQVADFTKTQAVKTAIETIIRQQDIAILINNSGGPKAGPIAEATPQEFAAAFSQHLLCNQILVHNVLPGMKAARYGRIINITSTSVKTPLPNLGVSNTIRAAVAAWAKTLANEVGKYNITVNNVLPGLTKTSRLQSLLEHTAAAQQKTVSNVAAEMISTIPMGRFGEAEEIANVIAFLASPAAAYVNGTSIPVDGGRTPTP